MKRIFVVEDDLGIRELLEYLLMSQEYAVKTFPTAGEFQNCISHESADLILMDVMLPDGNGLEMCRDLSKDPQRKKIPVMLMSAHADQSLFDENCVKDFIAKPFDVDDLLTRIRGQLS
ncbi:hypothetical protein GCM10007103_31430 [Salinimicrobium marinum]|uniref:Response regulatory domain-containing protein n=1 Tax=Salinimicrobium marinum TaxID=680283 RepID=A0A918SJT4_9FLAO|nr:response regulator [Salinimicrobium marinum]GHA48183.1 hypothetical protein GCM10007103_31430 [Salinimicrobium marinum]